MVSQRSSEKQVGRRKVGERDGREAMGTRERAGGRKAHGEVGTEPSTPQGRVLGVPVFWAASCLQFGRPTECCPSWPAGPALSWHWDRLSRKTNRRFPKLWQAEVPQPEGNYLRAEKICATGIGKDKGG